MDKSKSFQPEVVSLHRKGEVRGRSPDGKIIFVFKNGDKYIGPFENDKPKGRGTYTFINGDMFESTFDTDEDGCLTISDTIIYRWSNGNIYRGDFQISSAGNHMHGFTLSGKGILHHTDGSIYEGEFVNGVFDGNGTYRFSDGTTYTGQFKKGKMHGAGTMTHPNGSTEKGTFKDDLFSD